MLNSSHTPLSPIGGLSESEEGRTEESRSAASIPSRFILCCIWLRLLHNARIMIPIPLPPTIPWRKLHAVIVVVLLGGLIVSAAMALHWRSGIALPPRILIRKPQQRTEEFSSLLLYRMRLRIVGYFQMSTGHQKEIKD